jgi:hypothetical protein
MTAVIQADSFIETEDCNGPRYNRNAPSRENPGVLMTEIQNKYITEFELPYRNIERYIKEIGNNWNRLDDKQRSLVKTSFQNMGLVGKIGGGSGGGMESFGKEKFGTEISVPGPVDPNVANFIKYLDTDKRNTKKFMDTLWNTSPEQISQLGLTATQLSDIRDSMYQWSVDNTYVLHSNWRSGTLLFFFILIIIILIIVAATGGTEGNNAFGKSLFGRRF